MKGFSKPSIFENIQCEGIILYDSDDYHFMVSLNSESADPYFPIPYYTFNFSVGDFLVTNKATTTLTGYANQTYLQEQPGIPGAIGENIYGNITIEKSPDDAIAIISNRYDGMWGQTPGDSGFGAGIVLGIASLMSELKDDYGIFPRYNTTFLFTTGEEYGFRGAHHYSDLHGAKYEDKIMYWLVLDQLAFNQNHVVQELSISNTSKIEILKAIVADGNFEERTGYLFRIPPEGYITGTEQAVFAENFTAADVVCFADDMFYEWDHYHRTGQHFTDGDAMDNLDRNKGNVTAEIAWNVTKYFLYNPDCWFEGPISYSQVDIDSDSYIDSINATFTVKSLLPVDKVRVKASLKYPVNNITIFWKNFDFIATSEGTQKTITVTLPPTFEGEGNYSLYLELFNSTGRINEIVSSGVSDDSDLQSGSFILHPRGNVKPEKPNDIQGPDKLRVGKPGVFNSSTTDIDNDQIEYQWAWRKDKEDNWDQFWWDVDTVSPYASGEICEVEHTYLAPGKKTIQVRARVT
jgi:hypothetical protein